LLSRSNTASASNCARRSRSSNYSSLRGARPKSGAKRDFVRDQGVTNEAKLIDAAFSRFLVTRAAGVCDNKGHDSEIGRMPHCRLDADLQRCADRERRDPAIAPSKSPRRRTWRAYRTRARRLLERLRTQVRTLAYRARTKASPRLDHRRAAMPWPFGSGKGPSTELATTGAGCRPPERPRHGMIAEALQASVIAGPHETCSQIPTCMS
jgi:hypothetical protein